MQSQGTNIENPSIKQILLKLSDKVLSRIFLSMMLLPKAEILSAHSPHCMMCLLTDPLQDPALRR